MPTTHVNRDDVEARLERLREAYGDVTVVEGDEAVPADRFDDLLEEARDGYTGGGYGWVVRHPADAPALSDSMRDDDVEERTHVLLILHRGERSGDTDAPGWAMPGGGREDGETYEDAAVREIREETGVRARLGDPFLCYRGRHAPDDGRDVRLHTLWVHFDATYEGGSIRLQQGELRGAAWFARPPAGLRRTAQFRAREWWDEYEPPNRWWEGDRFERADE